MSLFLFLRRWRIAGELILLDNSSSVLSPTIYPELDGVSLDDSGHTVHKKKKKKRVSHYRSANRPTDNKCRRGCDDNYGSWLTSRSPFDFFFFHSFARRSDMKYSNGQRSLIRRPFSFSFSSFFLSLGSNRCRIANNVLPPSPCRSLPQLRE